jgi:DNA-binding GntR family transcriptional regulator
MLKAAKKMPVARAGAVRAADERAGKGSRMWELAYDRLEEMIVSCALRPGLLLSIPELQDRLRMGRTPTHLAVSRLAADTLIVIRPRKGLKIAPIDLARERILLRLRRDLERFAVRLAVERATPAHQAELAQIRELLGDETRSVTFEAFNHLDRRINHILIAASGVAFLESALRPLHTIFRRIGWIYHCVLRPAEGPGRTLDCHRAILDAVVARRAKEAVKAADALIAFNEAMLQALDGDIDPGLLDCNAGSGRTAGRRSISKRG